MADEAAEVQETPETQETPVKKPLALLAAERYGVNFHGEVPEESPEEVPPEETPAESLEEPDSEPEPEEEEVPISSLSELIEQNEWDPEWANSLKVQVKVDGKTTEIPISEAVKSYQISSAAEKRLEESKNKARAQQEAIAQRAEELNSHFATVSKVIEKAEAMLGEDFAGIDWKSLRTEDPAEYSAKQTELNNRRGQIEQMKSEARNEYQRWTSEQTAKHKAELEEYISAEREALLSKLPEWHDPEKAKSDIASLNTYLSNQGFSKDEIESAVDHRMIILARKASLYDQMKSENNPAKKKVVKIPKVMKPGSPKTQERVNQEELTARRKRLSETGNVKDALALLKASRKA